MRGVYQVLDGPVSSLWRFIPTCVGYTGRNAFSLLFRADVRFIPTCVGYTAQSPGSPADVPVHPHVRGVYSDPRESAAGTDGSSPRAWGIQRRGKMPRRPYRFIPTCVGYTIVFFPHGTHFFGSSPRAWGIRSLPGVNDVAVRFIPTCVGYTNRSHGIHLRPSGSSPRAWGIPPLCACWILDVSGSSPRAWGIPAFPEPLGIVLRFIPTCVGYTLTEFVLR